MALDLRVHHNIMKKYNGIINFKTKTK